MGDVLQPGLEGHLGPDHMGLRRGEGAQRSTGAAGAWSDFDILPCRDGRARRVERGVFPLVAGRPQSGTFKVVDGLPRGLVPSGDPSASEVQATAEARVSRLKGYGNSVCIPVAVEFILAAEEAIP